MFGMPWLSFFLKTAFLYCHHYSKYSFYLNIYKKVDFSFFCSYIRAIWGSELRGHVSYFFLDWLTHLAHYGIVFNYLNIAFLFRISTPVPEIISQIHSNPFPLDHGIFFKNYLADFFLKISPDFKGPFFTS